MGLACSSSKGTAQPGSLTYTELDQIIFIQHKYMKGELSEEQILPYFPQLNFKELEKEKNDKVKNRHFRKWFLMSYANEKEVEAKFNVEEIFKEAEENNRKINMEKKEEKRPSVPVFESQKISSSEIGLSDYSSKNERHFESRVVKAPPIAFRWLAWIIMAHLPSDRPGTYYNNILTYPINEKIEEQIQKDLTRTLEETHEMIQEIKESMYRILKALAVIDEELGYVQGINFICGFLLVISNRNELDTFYFLVSLFSHTFCTKFGMRFFFLEKFPFITVFTNVFEEQVQKKYPRFYVHMKEIQLPGICWISTWMQMLYVNVFPNEIVIRIWDCLFVYGCPFLISFALSIVEVIEKDFLELKDLFQITEYLKLLNPELTSMFPDKDKKINYDIEKMISTAINKHLLTWDDINPEINKVKEQFPDLDIEHWYKYQIIEPYSEGSGSEDKKSSDSQKNEEEEAKNLIKDLTVGDVQDKNNENESKNEKEAPKPEEKDKLLNKDNNKKNKRDPESDDGSSFSVEDEDIEEDKLSRFQELINRNDKDNNIKGGIRRPR